MPQLNHDPQAWRSVTPQLTCKDAANAIEFYKQALGAIEESRLPGPNGRIMHAMIRIGDSAVMLNEEDPKHEALSPQTLKGSPVTIHLYVDDADLLIERASRAGAKVTMPPEDMFWGDRYGTFTDPFGHHWSVGAHVRDVSEEEIAAAVKKMPKN